MIHLPLRIFRLFSRGSTVAPSRSALCQADSVDNLITVDEICCWLERCSATCTKEHIFPDYKLARPRAHRCYLKNLTIVVRYTDIPCSCHQSTCASRPDTIEATNHTRCSKKTEMSKPTNERTTLPSSLATRTLSRIHARAQKKLDIGST